MNRTSLSLIVAAAIGAAISAAPATAKPGHCPPGLAKKPVPCVPPGLAKKGAVPGLYGIGDRITGPYDLIRAPGRYGLDDRSTYYRVGNYVYRVDRNTREVLDLIGAAAAVLD